MGEMVSFASNGDTCEGYLADAERGPRPGRDRGPGVVGPGRPHPRRRRPVRRRGLRRPRARPLPRRETDEPDEAQRLLMGLAMDRAAKDIQGAARTSPAATTSTGNGRHRRVLHGRHPRAVDGALADEVKVAVGFYPAMPWERMAPTWDNYADKSAMIHAPRRTAPRRPTASRPRSRPSRRPAATSRSTTTPAPSTRSSTTSAPRSTPRSTRHGLAAHRRAAEEPSLTGSVPAAPGTGWPGDPAARDAGRARPRRRRRLAAAVADPGGPRRRACRSAGPARGWSPWREQVAVEKRRSFADEPYWGRPIAGLGRRAPRGARSSGSRRPRTAATAPAGSSPATAAATGCSPRCTGPAWPRSRRASHAGDGQRLIGTRMVAAVRCAPPANKPTPAERDTCAPWLDAELALRAAVRCASSSCLGSFAWHAALAGARAGWATTCRARGRASATARRGRAATDPARPPRRLLGCYHPSQQNTFTGKLTEPMLDAVPRPVPRQRRALHRSTSAVGSVVTHRLVKVFTSGVGSVVT